MPTVWVRRLGILLGVVYAIDCLVETWSHLEEGVQFWFLTTSIAATLVLVGALVRWSNPLIGAGLVATGGILGMLPTAWTLVIPVFAFAVVTVTVIDAGLRHDAQHP